MKLQQDASASSWTNHSSRYLRVEVEPQLSRFRWPISFPASPSFIPRAHSEIHSRRVLLAATRKTSATTSSVGRDRTRYQAFPASVKAQNLLRPPKCPAEESSLGFVPCQRIRDSFTVDAKFLYALRWNCVCAWISTDMHGITSSLFRATARFPVSSRNGVPSVVITSHPKWKTFSAATLSRNFVSLKITRAEYFCNVCES